MKKRGVALIVVLIASAAARAAPSPQAGPPNRIARGPEFIQRVNDAIDHGVVWLRKAQAGDGSFPDFPEYPGATTALAYYTLRVCGVARDDPAAKSAWASLRQSYRRAELKTYAAAVYLMAIAEHGERAAGAGDEHDVKLTKDDAKWAEEIVRSLAGGQDGDGAWGYMIEGSQMHRGNERLPSGYDHSNTQYALLGLKAAARCGIAIDPTIWRNSLVHFLATQEASGPEVRRGSTPVSKGGTVSAVLDHARGWCYHGRAETPRPGKAPSGRGGRGAADPPQPPMAGMTAGGVSSLVICRSELAATRDMTDKLDADSERAVWDGLAWLGANWSPTGDLVPSSDMPPKLREALGSGLCEYEFYGVERAGMLAAVDWMGELDWYCAGAAALLAHRSPDGSWTGLDAGLMVEDLAARRSAYRPIDTCFALLFLKKGTIPVRRGAVTSGGDDTDINFGEAAKLTGRDLEDFIELVLARWRRTSDAEVRRRLFDGATSAGPRIVEPLLVRLDFTDAARRAAAHALLRHATGLDFGYDPDGRPDAREEAVLKWQDWWMSSKDRVAYDAVAKRLVAR